MDKQTHLEIIDQEIRDAMETMFPHGAGRTTHTRVQHALNHIAQIAFTQGQTYALTSLLTIEDLAERFNITPRRARAIAKNRHERFGIGWQVPGTNQWLFRPEELSILEPNHRYQRKN